MDQNNLRNRMEVDRLLAGVKCKVQGRKLWKAGGRTRRLTVGSFAHDGEMPGTGRDLVRREDGGLEVSLKRSTSIPKDPSGWGALGGGSYHRELYGKPARVKNKERS